MLGGKYAMEGRVITAKMIAEFKEHLILEERSVATIQEPRLRRKKLENAAAYDRSDRDRFLFT